MSAIRRFLLRLASLVRRNRAEADAAREISAHLQLLEDTFIARGMSPSAARELARKQFGAVDLVMEAHREARSFMWWNDVRRDLRYAGRMLRRAPSLSAVAVLSLALGIGANTAVFSLADGLLLKSLAVPQPESLVNIQEIWPGSQPRAEAPTWEFAGLRDGSAGVLTVAAIAVFDRSNIALTSPGGAAVDTGRSRVAIVSGNYLPMLGIPAAMGRVLTPDDDRVRGGHGVAMVSDEYWTRWLDRTPDAVGRTLTINHTPFAIAGVMPRGFTGDWVGRPVDIWVTTMMQGVVMVEAPDALIRPNDYWLRLAGRLNPGTTRAQAEAAMQPVYQRVMRDAAGAAASAAVLEGIAKQRIELRPGGRGYSPERDRLVPFVTALSIVAALVLIIVCANVGGLLFVRGAAREREFAVRLAIGADRARLTRQLVIESAMLAAIGGAGGLAIAALGTRILAALLATAPVQMFWARSSWISFDVQFNWRALLFTAGVSLLAGLLFGLTPLIRAGRLTITSALTARATTAAGVRGFVFGKALVVFQAALALVVLAAATLLVRSLVALETQDLGFERDHLLLAWVQPSSTGRQGPELHQLWQDVQTQLSIVPGVASVSAWNTPLLSGTVPTAPSRPVEHMQVEGQARRLSTASGGRAFVMPGFFSTLGVPIVYGREFTERDTDTEPPVVIINQAMARFYFGDESPIGRRVRFGSQAGSPTEIVGVVRDFERGSPRSAGRERMWTYFPYRANSGGQLVIMCVVVRAHGDPRVLAAPVRAQLQRVDPALAVLNVNTIDDQLDAVLAQDRLLNGLAVFFGGVSVLLACLGLYGLIAHMALRRTAEMGLRIALGAAPSSVLAIVLRDGLRLAAIGVAIGIPAALAVTPVVSPYLFGVESRDAGTIAAASAAIAALALIAAYLPARRAAGVDPMTALRQE